MATPSRLSSAERRAAIVDAAIRLFAEKGFRGTTTRELAAAVGVSEPVLYQHFETKRDLYNAIIDVKSKDTPQRLDEALAPFSDARDDRGFFQALATLIVRWHHEESNVQRLFFFSALEGHELADLFFERNTECFMSRVAGYIERRGSEGAFRVVQPHFAAAAFANMVVHHAVSQTLFRDRLAIENGDAMVETMVDIFLEGIKQHDAEK